MKNKDKFVIKCKEFLKESDIDRQLLLIEGIYDIFNSSKMIEGTSDDLKIHSLKNIKETLTNYIHRDKCNIKDVNLLISLEALMIDD